MKATRSCYEIGQISGLLGGRNKVVLRPYEYNCSCSIHFTTKKKRIIYTWRMVSSSFTMGLVFFFTNKYNSILILQKSFYLHQLRKSTRSRMSTSAHSYISSCLIFHIMLTTFGHIFTDKVKYHQSSNIGYVHSTGRTRRQKNIRITLLAHIT